MVRRYRVKAGDRELTVEVELSASTPVHVVRVAVDGVVRPLDVRAIGDDARVAWRTLAWTAGTRAVLARIDGAPPKLTVALRGIEVPVQVVDAREAAVAEVTRSGARSAGPLSVRAPIPGRVVKLMVKPGDQVKAQQPVAVIEAMKMENELRAPREGLVSSVRVTEGSAVESGQELLVIG